VPCCGMQAVADTAAAIGRSAHATLLHSPGRQSVGTQQLQLCLSMAADCWGQIAGMQRSAAAPRHGAECSVGVGTVSSRTRNAAQRWAMEHETACAVCVSASAFSLLFLNPAASSYSSRQVPLRAVLPSTAVWCRQAVCCFLAPVVLLRRCVNIAAVEGSHLPPSLLVLWLLQATPARTSGLRGGTWSRSLAMWRVLASSLTQPLWWMRRMQLRGTSGACWRCGRATTCAQGALFGLTGSHRNSPCRNMQFVALQDE
jgi:hypothetical protein